MSEVYVFIVKRPRDSAPWPCVYTDEALAKAAFGRVSPVLTVMIPPPSVGRCDECEHYFYDLGEVHGTCPYTGCGGIIRSCGPLDGWENRSD